LEPVELGKLVVQTALAVLHAPSEEFVLRQCLVAVGIGLVEPPADALDADGLSYESREIRVELFEVEREIAVAILFLASDDAGFITGATLPVDGGYTAGKGW
jgi:NAD(P)-dependent dehydrogenase (short-subunit alcohol dehydrogenase family)